VATRKLTKKTIDALPIRDRVYIAYDNVLPGFGCRVTPNGARSWIVEYRPHGGGRSVAKRRITLGSISVLTPDQAREAAGDVLAKVRFGEDAPHDRAARRSSPMVADLIDEFMNEEIRPTRKPRTAELYDMYFRVHVAPALGSKRAREVTSADVGKLHRKIGTGRRSPPTALLRSFLVCSPGPRVVAGFRRTSAPRAALPVTASKAGRSFYRARNLHD
jgi:Arm DNA-binding domain/Phage integrase, N-terminal SAM-like domain